MELRISELAQAVEKSDTYVRQHIHRKHLTARREGRKVFVELEEATRWARKWGLPFDAPARISASSRHKTSRAARMTVLECTESGGRARNLFTMVRHRRQDALGPWESQDVERWLMDDLGSGLRLHRLNAPLEKCQALVDLILDSGKLEIEGVEVTYALHPNPRCHWAYRDESPLSDASARSPFSRHSAEVIEYWSFESDLRDRWLKVLDSPPDNLPRRLGLLGFPLDRRSDRVGNLMIAGAEDAITCELAACHDQTLRFQVKADNLQQGTYSAEVWASHSGDEVTRKQILVTLRQTTIKLASDIDHVGFSVFRNLDGQCVDLTQAHLVMEVRGLINLASGTSMHFKSRRSGSSHTIETGGVTSEIEVRSDEHSAQIDREIRRWWLDSRLYERDAEARKERRLVRFQADQFDQAVQHLIQLVRLDAHRKEPIYLADPHFMPYLDEKKEADSKLVQLYLELFAATVGRPLRILCAKQRLHGVRPWWLDYPKTLLSHVSVRTFHKHEKDKNAHLKRGFHDRYVTTPEHEVIITNSLNGWNEHGVTFVSHRYGVYSAEAERLWSMGVQSVSEALLVDEFL